MWKKFLGVYVVLALVALAMAPTDAVSQMCESTDGSPRECTISEELDFCLFAAVDAADQRACIRGPVGRDRLLLEACMQERVHRIGLTCR